MDVASPVNSRPPNWQGVLNVKNHLLWATLLASIAAICLSPTAAIAQAAGPSGTNVAVIDMLEVFKHHQRLQAQLADIKKDAQLEEAKLRDQRSRLQSLADQLKTLKPDTPDYVAKEKAFASMQADLNVQLRQKTREFQEREARIRYNVYQEVVEYIGRFARQYNIQLVLLYSRQPIDTSKPQSVLMGLSRPIVYQNKLDITDHVIAAFDRPPVPVANRGPAIPTPRR